MWFAVVLGGLLAGVVFRLERVVCLAVACVALFYCWLMLFIGVRVYSFGGL